MWGLTITYIPTSFFGRKINELVGFGEWLWYNEYVKGLWVPLVLYKWYLAFSKKKYVTEYWNLLCISLSPKGIEEI